MLREAESVKTESVQTDFDNKIEPVKAEFDINESTKISKGTTGPK